MRDIASKRTLNRTAAFAALFDAVRLSNLRGSKMQVVTR